MLFIYRFLVWIKGRLFYPISKVYSLLTIEPSYERLLLAAKSNHVKEVATNDGNSARVGPLDLYTILGRRASIFNNIPSISISYDVRDHVICFASSVSNILIEDLTIASIVPSIVFLITIGALYITLKKKYRTTVDVTKKTRKSKPKSKRITKEGACLIDEESAKHQAVLSDSGYHWNDGCKVSSSQVNTEDYSDVSINSIVEKYCDVDFSDVDEEENEGAGLQSIKSLKRATIPMETTKLISQELTMDNYLEHKFKRSLVVNTEGRLLLIRKVKELSKSTKNEIVIMIKKEFDLFIKGKYAIDCLKFGDILGAALSFDYSPKGKKEEAAEMTTSYEGDKILPFLLEQYRLQFKESIYSIIYLIKNPKLHIITTFLLQEYFLYCSRGEYGELKKFNASLRAMMDVLSDGFESKDIVSVTICKLIVSLDRSMISKTIVPVVKYVLKKQSESEFVQDRIIIIAESLTVYLCVNHSKITNQTISQFAKVISQIIKASPSPYTSELLHAFIETYLVLVHFLSLNQPNGPNKNTRRAVSEVYELLLPNLASENILIDRP